MRPAMTLHRTSTSSRRTHHWCAGDRAQSKAQWGLPLPRPDRLYHSRAGAALLVLPTSVAALSNF
jgi:hypothetical protein